ncbi:MAG: hypothetical protein WD336_10545, partial [Trueperaceae bacterium]
MPRGPKSGYLCESCGARTPAPMGRCPSCGAWGTLVASTVPEAGPASTRRGAPEAVTTTTLDAASEHDLVRIPSGDGEVDRVLGGGW